ncbi:hypothetical protein [Streptodolium elevatio]
MVAIAEIGGRLELLPFTGLAVAVMTGVKRKPIGRAGFRGPEHHIAPGGQPLERSSDDIVAGVFSMSLSAPHQFGDRRAEFEADLRNLLRCSSPGELFSERQPATEVHIWRKAS